MAEQLDSDWFDWRSTCTTIQDLNAHILESGFNADIIFVIDEECDGGDESADNTAGRLTTSRIKAHQFILKLRSPVFETMFNEIWKNKKGATETEEKLSTTTTDEHEVKLVDTTSEYFQAFLKFLYSDYFNEQATKEQLIGLLYLAHKYIVSPLAQKCSQSLMKIICLKNVIEIYEVAELFQQYELRDTAFDFMLKYARALVVEPHFLTIQVPLLKKLMMADNLQIEEVNLFRALLRWTCHKLGWNHTGLFKGSKECSSLLSEIIPLIRFTTMESQEFSSILDVASAMLEKEEIIQIYMHLTTPPTMRNSLPKLRFDLTKRLLPANEGSPLSKKGSVNLYLYTESCDRNRLNYLYGPNGRIHDETVQFTTSHNIIISGIGLFGPSIPPGTTNDFNFYTHHVDIAIYTVEAGPSGHRNPRVIVSRSRRTLIVPNDYEITFDPPVKVSTAKIYHIQLAFKGEETKRGVSRLSTIKSKCGGKLVVFSLVANFLADGLHPQPQGRIRSINFELDD